MNRDRDVYTWLDLNLRNSIVWKHQHHSLSLQSQLRTYLEAIPQIPTPFSSSQWQYQRNLHIQRSIQFLPRDISMYRPLNIQRQSPYPNRLRLTSIATPHPFTVIAPSGTSYSPSNSIPSPLVSSTGIFLIHPLVLPATEGRLTIPTRRPAHWNPPASPKLA